MCSECSGQEGSVCTNTQTHLPFPWQTYRLFPKKVHSDLEACEKMHILPCVDCPARGRVTPQIGESPAYLRRVEEGAKAK